MMRSRYVGASIFLLVFGMHSTSPVSLQGDSRWTIPQALALLHKGTFALDDYASRFPAQNFYFIECVSAGHRWTFPVQEASCPGGHFYYWYPPALSLLAAPLVGLIQAGVHFVAPLVRSDRPGPVGAFFHEDLVTGSPIVEMLVASFFVAGAAAALFFALLALVSIREAALLALVFAFCTSAWSASRALGQHAPSMFLNCVCLILICRPSKRLWLIGPLAALAFFVRSTNIVPVCVFGVYLHVYARRQAMLAVVAALPVVALFAGQSLAVYGTMLPPYFTSARLDHPLLELHPRLLEALAGNWISPGRGMLVYCPFFLLLFFPAAWRTDVGSQFTRLRPYLWAIVVITWITVSMHEFWWSGYAYGPRYLSDLLPFMMVLMAPVVRSIFVVRMGLRFDRAILTATVAVALFIHARAAYSIAVHDWNRTPVDVNVAPERVWDWSDPPFLRGLLK